MAEKVLSKIHALKENGIVVPEADCIRVKRMLKEDLDEEQKKQNPDKANIAAISK